MDAWLPVLLDSGARISDGGLEVSDFGQPLAAEQMRAGFFSPLTDLGLIALTGADAPTFLHNQITNDVQNLGTAQARLAGYCTPKGRLLASFLMWKSPAADATGGDTGIFLQVPREILPALQKRLQMFVLRAKVKLVDAGAGEQPLLQLGLGGQAAAQVLQQWFPALPAPYAKADNAHGTLVRVADAFGAARFVWIAPAATLQAAWPALAAALKPAGNAVWRLAGIEAGVPQISAATQDQFVPQMINLEVIGAVNFQKGCYPGQEIVARSQYLGKRKRRMMRAVIEAATLAPAAGMEVFSSTDPGQPCGMIVNAAPDAGTSGQAEAAQSYACLVEIKLDALEAGTVHLAAPEGPTLRFVPLPYALPAENDA